MSSNFAVITEEFSDDLVALRSLVNAFNDPRTSTPKARIVAVNSATLLLAATFEEFVREMARAYARTVVAATDSIDRLPPKLAGTAWRRTMQMLASVRIDTRNAILPDALARFNVVYEFCKGDLSQDIYEELIHNENNMRPGEINALFKVSNLKDVCSKLAHKQAVLDNFGEVEGGKAHGQLLASFDDFFERRNSIAHSLNLARSSGADQIMKDIEMLEAFAKALCETLEEVTTMPQPAAAKVDSEVTLRNVAASPPEQESAGERS